MPEDTGKAREEGVCATLVEEGREIKRVWKMRQLGSQFRNDRGEQCEGDDRAACVLLSVPWMGDCG